MRAEFCLTLERLEGFSHIRKTAIPRSPDGSERKNAANGSVVSDMNLYFSAHPPHHGLTVLVPERFDGRD